MEIQHSVMKRSAEAECWFCLVPHFNEMKMKNNQGNSQSRFGEETVWQQQKRPDVPPPAAAAAPHSAVTLPTLPTLSTPSFAAY